MKRLSPTYSKDKNISVKNETAEKAPPVKKTRKPRAKKPTVETKEIERLQKEVEHLNYFAAGLFDEMKKLKLKNALLISQVLKSVDKDNISIIKEHDGISLAVLKELLKETAKS